LVECILAHGEGRKSDRASSDRENCGKKDPLSESVDHTLGDMDRFLNSTQVGHEGWSIPP
jgi:hypothetical protein